MKSLKTKIMYIVNIVLAVLGYIFMSQAYVAYKGDTFGFDVDFNASGYDLIGFEGNGTSDMIAVSNIFVCIFLAVLILASIYGLLVSFGAVKDSKFTKIANMLNVISAVIFFVFSVIAMICIFVNIADTPIMKDTYTAGWAVILNLILGLVTLVTSILASNFAKK